MELDGSTELLLKGVEGVFGGLSPRKVLRFQTEKCILVEPGDGFAMDNGESKNSSGPIGGPDPSPPHGSATASRHTAAAS